MRKAFGVIRRILLVLVLIPVGVVGLVNLALVFVLASNYLHQTRYVENYTYDPDRLYPPEVLQEDFAIFRGALEESHGALYRYTPQEELDTAFDAAAEKLDEPMTELAFVKVLAPVVDLIRDGHTLLRLPVYHSGSFDYSEQGLLPLDLAATETGIYMERDGSAEEVIPPGSEVLSINGRAMSELKDEMLSLLKTVDGHTEQTKLRAINNRDFLTDALGYLQNFPETFEVTYREPGSEEKKNATLQALTYYESGDNITERYGEPADSTAGVSLTWQDDVPVLEIENFVEGSYNDYIDTLKNVFAEIKQRGAEQLVIDFRENDGGSVKRANLLFAYLHPEPSQKLEEYSAKAVRSDYLKYTETPWFHRWQNLLLSSETEEFSFSYRPETGRWWRDESNYSSHYKIEEIPISAPFAGQVYLLLSGHVISASAELATMAEERLPNLITVGQETSGAYQGATGGYFYNLILPNTHIGVAVPRAKFVLAVEGDNPPECGVLPDHEVWPTQEDIAAGVDTELAFTLDLIKQTSENAAQQ